MPGRGSSVLGKFFASAVVGASADGTCGAGTVEAGVNFPGHDLKPVHKINASDAGECCTLCTTTSGCRAFSFVADDAPGGYGYGVCWLKESDAGRTPQEGRSSGVTVVSPPTPPTPPPSPPPTPPGPVPGPAPGPSSCATCRGPQWSWDTFPAFWHSADASGPGGGFSEEALDTIARFPMATLEKWQGADVHPPIFQEEAWIVAAKQLKARRPDITVIVWYDSLRIYTEDKSLNPDLRGPCAAGHFRAAEYLETHPEYLLKNKSGLPALESWSGCHIHDYTKDFAQSYWREMCLNVTASGVVDGCGADASWQTGVDQDWGLDDATAAAWAEGHKEMMRGTTKALGEGVLLGKNPEEVGDYVNGALHEGCAAKNETVNTLRTLTQLAQQQERRLIYQCHGKGGLDEVAAFLVGAGPYHYYGLGGWHGTGKHGNFSEHWMPGVFDRALGAPIDDAVYDPSTDEWARSFASGTLVRFNAKTNEGEISWGSEPHNVEVAV